jgi:hypothetical protein
MAANGTCYVCYESQPPPIQSGCACRGEAGFVHIECMVQVAVSQVGHRGNTAWWGSHTCKQHFTGAMRTGLAEAWWARVRDAVEENAERQSAAYNLGQSLCGEGTYGEAERTFREVHGIRMRVLGPEHPRTVSCASEIASCLMGQGNYAHAEQSIRTRSCVRSISPASPLAKGSMPRRCRSTERCLSYGSACWDRSIRRPVQSSLSSAPSARR